MIITLEDVGRVCHETHRTWCEINDDYSQPYWPYATLGHRENLLQRVTAALDGTVTAEQLCAMRRTNPEEWISAWNRATGGRSYEPNVERVKDELFLAIVHAMAPFLEDQG